MMVGFAMTNSTSALKRAQAWLPMACLALTFHAAQAEGPGDSTIAPPTDKTPQARVLVADFRYGDVLWENDRTAHRIYSRALEVVEPPSTSGIDVWGKLVRWPYMERQLRTGDQHSNHGEGLDFYNVNVFRGAGGLGIWDDNKLWVSRNYSTVRILKDGPEIARFEVDYAAWPVGTGRKVWETRRFELPLGTNFTRMTTIISSDRKGPLIVGIGITKRPTSGQAGTLSVDRVHGKLSWWGPDEPGKGAMAVALMVDPAAIVDVRDEANDHLVLIRITSGKPFVYYMGGAWSGGNDFKSADAWTKYVTAQTPDFTPKK